MGRWPLLVWFASQERILSVEEQQAIILRVRWAERRMRERSRMFWFDPETRCSEVTDGDPRSRVV